MSKLLKKIPAAFLVFTLLFTLASCGGDGGGNADGGNSAEGGGERKSGVEDGVLTVAMECTYAPYNWAQPGSENGAVPIKGSNLYANGYDVMTAKEICEANGWELEIMQLDWDSIIPAIQSGLADAGICGQSMTPERLEEVDFAGPYLYATMVCLTKKGSAFENAAGISDLSGGICTSQSGTIWYNTCLPQIEGAKIQAPAESAPAMLMELQSGAVDFICCDMPTAQGALIAYPDFKLLDFQGTNDDFKVEESDVDIGVSVAKGNSVLKDAINKALEGKTREDFNRLMEKATAIQPMSGE